MPQLYRNSFERSRILAEATRFTNLAGLPGGLGSANGTGSEAGFDEPWGVAVDSTGNVYVADTYNDIIRKVTPWGEVTTIAGRVGNYGSADGTNSTAQFYNPASVAVGPNGNVYVADTYNYTIRRLTPAGTN